MKKQPQERVQQALRVGVFLQGRLIEERLFFEPSSIAIGRSSWRTDIVVPSDALPSRVELFSTSEGQFCLMRVDGATIRLVRSAEAALETVGSAFSESIPLRLGMRGKISMGEVAVMFHAIKRRRLVGRTRLPRAFRGAWWWGLNPMAVSAIVLSALLQGGFVAWVLSQEWPEPLEAQVLAENGFAQVLIQPNARDKPPEPNEPVENNEKDAPKGSNSEDSAAADHTDKPARRDAKPESNARAERLRMSEQVERETIIGVIGSHNADGENAVDQILALSDETDVEEAFAGARKVRGGQVGTDRFAGSGRADEGPGKAVSVGGLERGEGARRAELGVEIGGKSEQDVECKTCAVTMPPPPTSGSQTTAFAQAVNREIRRTKARIKNCYERRVKLYPGLSGKVVVTFTIVPRGKRGRVSDSRASVDIIGRGVGECVAGEIKRLRVPIAPDGPAYFNIAFLFESGG